MTNAAHDKGWILAVHMWLADEFPQAVEDADGAVAYLRTQHPDEGEEFFSGARAGLQEEFRELA